jgi:hypothetical protein
MVQAPLGPDQPLERDAISAIGHTDRGRVAPLAAKIAPRSRKARLLQAGLLPGPALDQVAAPLAADVTNALAPFGDLPCAQPLSRDCLPLGKLADPLPLLRQSAPLNRALRLRPPFGGTPALGGDRFAPRLAPRRLRAPLCRLPRFVAGLDACPLSLARCLGAASSADRRCSAVVLSCFPPLLTPLCLLRSLSLCPCFPPVTPVAPVAAVGQRRRRHGRGKQQGDHRPFHLTHSTNHCGEGAPLRLSSC